MSLCIFSILFFLHFLRCWQGEFVYWSKASFVDNHFLHSHNLNVWFRGDVVRRNLMLVTLRGSRVKPLNPSDTNIITSFSITYSLKSRCSPLWIVVCHWDTRQSLFPCSTFLLMSFSIVSVLMDPFMWAWSS